MDTEKHIETQKKILEGKSPTDEGPFYHHSWWESYKGSIKGKLGGVVVGALIGAIMGAAVAAIAGAVVGTGGALAIIGGFAAAGSLYGAHEFSAIGKIVGAQAATQELAEVRMKSFEEGKFAELKHEIAELKSIVKGEPVPPPLKKQSEPGYRTTHFAKLHSPDGSRPVFWKVALIGLVVGVAAGALLAYGGVAGHLLDGLMGEGQALSALGLYTASMTAFGALGASFGINRDIFRKIFDTTDLWIKGMITHEKVRENQIASGKVVSKAKAAAIKKEPEVATTVSYEGYIDYPASSTHHRDRVLAAAEKALLSFDHTRATPQ